METEQNTLANGSQAALRRLEEESSLGSLNDIIAYINGQRFRQEIPLKEWAAALTWTDGDVCLEFEERGRCVWATADAEGSAQLALEPLPGRDESEIQVAEATGVGIRAMVQAYKTRVVHRSESGFAEAGDG